ncbi:MAG: polymer-forming cytoskeletal protein [Nitrososphaerales archaeon]|jgi:cytoskeletal protein CcmA (bactofilin family)
MTDCEVRAGTTATLGTVEGELRAGRNVTIRAQSGGRVVVTGGATFEGAAAIGCDFECRSMRVEGRGYGPGGDVAVRGDLTVHERADINASTRVAGDVRADDLDVGGHFRSRSLTARRARVGGHMTVEGALKAESVDVGGHAKVGGAVDLVNLRVGGHAEIGGGKITGEIKVRGHLRTSKELSFGEVEVFGSLRLPAGSGGHRLKAIGTVEFEGDARCDELEVSGTARVRGDLAAESIEVRGRLSVSGSIRVVKKLRVYGTVDATGAIQCETLGVLGRLTAEHVTAAGHVDIAGEVNTAAGLKAGSVLVGRSSRVTGPLVGGEVEVGRETDFGSMWGLPWWRSAVGGTTRVEDLYGTTVRIWPNSSVGRVFGEVVELREGTVARRITYTSDLKLSGGRVHDPPVKAEKLPDPPL